MVGSTGYKEITASTNGASTPLYWNFRQSVFRVSIDIRVAGGFDGTWSLEHSLDGTNWFVDDQAKDKAVALNQTIISPARASRISISGMSTGSVTFGALQAV